MGELIAAHGMVAFAEAWLRARGLDWAAELIAAEQPIDKEADDDATA